MRVDMEKVRILRGEKQMSVQQLAEQSKVPAQTIRRSAKGCRPETAGKIAKALGVTLLEIIVSENKEVE